MRRLQAGGQRLPPSPEPLLGARPSLPPVGVCRALMATAGGSGAAAAATDAPTSRQDAKRLARAAAKKASKRAD